jgi:hypothetical protein
MTHVKEAISPEQLQEPKQTPPIDELEKTVRLLANNKAPGFDGLTAKVICRCWEFMKEDILKAFC